MHHYFILFRTYESFIKLNESLLSYGFKFEAFQYEEFLENFSRIISSGVELKSKDDISRLYYTSPIFDFYTLTERPIVVLRSIDGIGSVMEREGISQEEVMSKNTKFVKFLITVLRLHKNGMIEEIMDFTYDRKSTRFGQVGFNRKHKDILEEEYLIEDRDVPLISQLLKNKLEINELTELALDSFQLVYEIKNKQLQFITLMTALESLFNIGRDQISHTVSRHLSILLSTSETEFHKNYKSIKKLYNYRSTIVHGHQAKEKELEIRKIELENYVRSALKATIRLKMNKDQLFEMLNAKGF